MGSLGTILLAFLSAAGGGFAAAAGGGWVERRKEMRAGAAAARLVYAELSRCGGELSMLLAEGYWDLGTSDASWRTHSHSIARVVGFEDFAAVQQAYWSMDTVDPEEAVREDVESAYEAVKRAMIVLGPLAGLPTGEVARRHAKAEEG